MMLAYIRRRRRRRRRRIPAAARRLPRRRRVRGMEESKKSSSSKQQQQHIEQHYNHNDTFNRFRWTARESFQFMYGGVGRRRRAWHKVAAFYSHLLLNDHTTHALSALLFPHHHKKKHEQQPDDQDGVSQTFHGCQQDSKSGGSLPSPTETKTRTGGRWERLTFKIVLSYRGTSFDGWQKQPALNTVQGVMEKILGKFVDDRKAQQLKEKSLPLEGCAVVAGRTDKGVTALQQVCSFYTWRKDVYSDDIKNAINDAAPGKLRAVSVSQVSRAFHPNFSAKWRRYFYIFPLDVEDQGQTEGGFVTIVDKNDDQMKEQTEYNEFEWCSVVYNGNEDLTSKMKPRSFSVGKVNELLRQLEGKSLSYKMFARDTKASRNMGPPTECFMFHARAEEANLPCFDQACTELRVMCVELIANRFLRKMVRVLVATAIREAAAGANEDALLNLMDASCRRATAPPAPPDGLCLVDVGYGDFKKENCFIQ